MAFVNFIEFNSDKTVAQSVRKSPLTTIHTRSGIQLLPNNELPYIQSTNVSGGIELEDITAYIVDCKGNETDITPYFIVDRVFTNDKGEAQFDWKLTNVPFDFGYDDVYLKVEQSIGETFYSNLFRLSGYYSEKTCRIDYMNGDVMNAIQINIFFWQELKNVEIGVYYEYSTRNTVNTTVKSQRHERWTTEFVPNDLMLKVSDVFENKPVYVDLKRCYLFEAIEIKEFEAEEDFKENQIKLSFNNDDIYDPTVIEEPIPLDAEIILNSVVYNGISAIFDFYFINFIPQSLFFQWSQDQTNWTTTEKGFTSPQIFPFNGTDTWYFRIIHPEAESNIITLDLGSAVQAINDNVQVEKGQSIDINVLFNDTLVGNTIVTAVTTPSNGTATIIDNGTKVRYDHDDSNTTFDTFNYTIDNGFSNDSAAVNIVITAIENGTSFSISSNGRDSSEDSCLLPIGDTLYHNGESAQPFINDFVFTDSSLNNIFNGLNKYYAISGGKFVQIDNNGQVQDLGFCGSGGSLNPS